MAAFYESINFGRGAIPNPYRRSGDSVGHPPAFAGFFHEGDGAGGAKFAIQFRVPAHEAVPAKIGAVFHAFKFGLDFRVVDAFSHCFVSLMGYDSFQPKQA
jgi:hypothetical protein